MPKQTVFREDADKLLLIMLDEAADEIEKLEEAMKEVRRFSGILRDLQRYVVRQWPLHVLDLMEKEDGFLKTRCESEPVLAQELEHRRRVAQDQAEKLRIWYPKFLEEACEKVDLPLDMTSRHPEYTFEEGFFELTVHRRIAVLSNSERKLAEFPADIGAVVAKVKAEHELIFSRPYDGVYFLRKLREHYLEVVQRQGQDDGASVPIRRIAGRIASEKKGYHTDQFIVDLSRMAREGPLEIDGKRLDLQHTRDSREGILLHNVGTLSFVGFVSFQEVGS